MQFRRLKAERERQEATRGLVVRAFAFARSNRSLRSQTRGNEPLSMPSADVYWMTLMRRSRLCVIDGKNLW